MKRQPHSVLRNFQSLATIENKQSNWIWSVRQQRQPRNNNPAHFGYAFCVCSRIPNIGWSDNLIPYFGILRRRRQPKINNPTRSGEFGRSDKQQTTIQQLLDTIWWILTNFDCGNSAGEKYRKISTISISQDKSDQSDTCFMIRQRLQWWRNTKTRNDNKALTNQPPVCRKNNGIDFYEKIH